MEKTFTYDTIKKSVFGNYETEFKYTVDNEELLEAVADCVYDDYFRCKSDISYNVEFVTIVKRGLKEFVRDYDNLDELVDRYENELKEYFRDEAIEYFENKED